MSLVMSRSSLSFSLLLLLLCFSASSDAVDFGTLSLVGSSGSGATVSRGVVKSVVEHAPAGSGATVLGEFQLLLKRRPYIITAGRAVTAEGIIGGALKLAKTMGPLGLIFTLGPLIWDPIKGMWTKPEGDQTYPDGKWCTGKGTANESCAGDPAASCSGYYSKLGKIFARVYPYSDPGRYACLYCQVSSTEPCHEVNNATTLKYLDCPAGYLWDSLVSACRAKLYVPASDSDLVNAITNKVNESPANAASQANKNKENDEPGFVTSMGPINSVSGPASSVPDVSVKETAKTEEIPDVDGDQMPEIQTTNTTTTTTTTYNFSYQNDNSVLINEQTETNVQTSTSVTYSTTNTSVVTNTTNSTTTINDNDTSPITLPVSNPGPTVGGGDSGSTSNEWPLFCSWASKVCEFIDWVKQGPTLPSAPVIPTQDISPVSQSWSLNLGGGTCPADVDVSLPQGQHLTYSYSPLCMALTVYIAPIVMLMSSILSLYILAGVKVD